MLDLGVFLGARQYSKWLEALVSPILVRPVREQLEHDRVIRLLQVRFRRRFEVAINPGAEQNAAAGTGLYPDLVLLAQDRGRRPQVVIEVETGESVNHLEALAQWAHFARLKTPFHLYVPSGMVDVARRLCADNAIVANEIWTYHNVGEEVRFTMVHRTKDTHVPKAATARPAMRSSKKAIRPKREPPRARAVARGKARAAKPVRKSTRGQKRR